MIGAEQPRGAQTIMVLKPRGNRQAIGQQFQHNIAMQTGPHRLSMLFGMMRNKSDRFFEIACKHDVPPFKQNSASQPEQMKSGKHVAVGVMQVGAASVPYPTGV